MAARKNKGARDSAAPEASSAFVLVTNTRGGPIHVGPVTFPPGSSVHEAAVFAAFSREVSDALTDMVTEGWLKFEGSDAPEAPVPELPKVEVPAEEVSPFPTLEQVKLSASPAELDGWFQLPGLPVELSEAILSQHSLLSPA